MERLGTRGNDKEDGRNEERNRDKLERKWDIEIK